MRAYQPLFFLFVLLQACGSCTPPPPGFVDDGDAGAVDAGTSLTDAGVGGDAGPRSDAGPVICADTDAICDFPSECCTNVCEASRCAGSEVCGGAGEACQGPGDCCSNLCAGDRCQIASTCQGLAASCELAVDCCSGSCVNSQCVVDNSCQASGGQCDITGDCCVGDCFNEECVPPPAICAGEGTPCASPSGCCSGRCEPLQGTGETRCLSACFGDGAPCERSLDCCDLACNDGVCGGEICQVSGEDCAVPSDCCSNICSGGRCEVDEDQECRPSGEDCSSGGPLQCCGVCDEQEDRCTFAGETCRASGASCQLDDDCCRGTCTDDVCVSPVGAAPDAGPSIDGGGAQLQCLPVGFFCVEATDCCGDFCFGGRCDIFAG